MRLPLSTFVRALGAGFAALACLSAAAADAPMGAATNLAPLASPGSTEVDALPAPPPSPVVERVRLLEAQIDELTVVNRQQQEAVLSLRNRLATSQSSSGWVPLLGIGFGAMSLIAGSLGVQLLRVNGERRREREERRLKRLIDAADGEFEPRNRRQVTEPHAPQTAVAAKAVELGEVPPTTPKTAPLTRIDASAAAQSTAVLGGSSAAREVSVEEMLDLDQQADFFLALGQDEAAIDLLMGHIRGGGGASPMPYLKLLDIYHRRADAEEYARMRERFNLRFNAIAPPLDADFHGGRDLEQYESVVARLTASWSRPSDAVKALDEVLAHRGTPEPFDLPAFRDLVLLLAVARDLLTVAVPEVAPDGVDLELPLDVRAERPDNGRAVRQALASRLHGSQALPPELMSHLLVNRERYSGQSSLDLDLSDFSPAPREFTRPAAFTDVEQREDHRHSDMSGFDELDPPARKRRR